MEEILSHETSLLVNSGCGTVEGEHQNWDAYSLGGIEFSRAAGSSRDRLIIILSNQFSSSVVKECVCV